MSDRSDQIDPCSERPCPQSEAAPETFHVPVMVDQVLAYLEPKPGAVIVDGTLGGGGHTRELARRVTPGGQVIALDRDPRAVAAGSQRLEGLPVECIHGNFADIPEILHSRGIHHVDGVLLDLGLSSDQLADPTRGFSFQSAGPLDLRFDPTCGQPAYRLINRLSERQLAELIWRFGEDRYSRRIARAIVQARRHQPIRTASQLAAIVRGAVPAKAVHQRIDPATRTFQALRIAVNEELKWIQEALKRIPECLPPGGRCVVISFHSLEDRIVKSAFRSDPRWTVLTRKPARPSEQQLAQNPRARSAKLRAAERT